MTAIAMSVIEDETQDARLIGQPLAPPAWLSSIRYELGVMLAQPGRTEPRTLRRAMSKGLGVLVRVAEAVPHLQRPTLEVGETSVVWCWGAGQQRSSLRVDTGPRLFLTVSGREQHHSPTNLTFLVRELRSAAAGSEPVEADLHSELCSVVRELHAQSRPHVSEALRALAGKAVAARKSSGVAGNEWTDDFANLVIDGFDE
ncbi:MAG: hypothetical protein V3V08_00925 [Nannocystaceae bacterium]